MSAKVASELRKRRTRSNPSRRDARLKPQPLIFEPQHKNIATLIAFLLTIFVGLGAGWLVGSALPGSSKPTPVEQAQVVTETEQAAPDNSIDEAGAAKQAETRPPIIEENVDNDEPRTRARQRAGSRRVQVAPRAGESIPVAVIKGKPLKKAFRQFKKVRIW